MSLTQAMSIALSGLASSQSGLSVIAANVANAQTPGYTRKTAVPVTTTSADLPNGVRVSQIQREFDAYVQRQLRTESSGGTYATTMADYTGRLDQVFGAPGEPNALDTQFNSFTGALQQLSASPDSLAARTQAIGAAQVMAQHLNGMTNDIQELRAQTEIEIGDVVSRLDNALNQISKINAQLASDRSSTGSASASLLDERDKYIDEVAQYIDIKVVKTDMDRVNVFTNSGSLLVADGAVTLSFDGHSTLTANTQWSSDPNTRGVGTILMTNGDGNSVDLIASKQIRSGKLAALIELRDSVLVKAQTQVDNFAAVMSRALSDVTVPGVAASSGAATGFEVDMIGMQPGDPITLNYTETPAGTQRTVQMIGVESAGSLPLPANPTGDPSALVVGYVIGATPAATAANVQTALNAAGYGSGLTVSASGSNLRILDDGAAATRDVTGLSLTRTETSLTGGSAALPMFVDSINGVYSGRFDVAGAELTGFAGRITLNSGLLSDPSRLVVMSTSPLTDSGNPTRPNFLVDQLTQGRFSFSSTTGVSGTGTAYTGTLSGFTSAVIQNNGQQAEMAQQLKQGQDIVVSALQSRFDESAAVNIDQEMANLLVLQNAYGASARILSAVKEMYDYLMKM